MTDLAASGHPGAAATTQQDVAQASASNMAAATTGPGMEQGTGDVARQRAVMPTGAGEGPGEPEPDADADDALGFLGLRAQHLDQGGLGYQIGGPFIPPGMQELLTRLGIR